MISVNKNFSCFLFVFLFWAILAYSSGNEISNVELIDAAGAVAAGRATEQQQAILFANNHRLNNLAMAGKISAAEYQINQKMFVAKNDELIRQAAGRNGLNVAPPPEADFYKPGTDTDRQIYTQEGKLSVENVKQTRDSYNKAVTEYLKKSGIKVDMNENWAAKLSTDIMPSPYEMTPADFKAANRFINASGGLTYTDATAAKIQLEHDSGNLKTPALHEAEACHLEMQKKINQMNDEIVKLKNSRAKISDPEAVGQSISSFRCSEGPI